MSSTWTATLKTNIDIDIVVLSKNIHCTLDVRDKNHQKLFKIIKFILFFFFSLVTLELYVYIYKSMRGVKMLMHNYTTKNCQSLFIKQGSILLSKSVLSNDSILIHTIE